MAPPSLACVICNGPWNGGPIYTRGGLRPLLEILEVVLQDSCTADNGNLVLVCHCCEPGLRALDRAYTSLLPYAR